MPLAPGLLVRTLVRPGGRVTTVVVRRRRTPAPQRQPVSAERRVSLAPAEGKPERIAPVPAGRAVLPAGFSRPIARALAVLGTRARPFGRDGVLLDGRRAPLTRVVAEANRSLTASGRPPIRYPGVRPQEDR